MGEYFFLNGRIVPAGEAMLNLTDLALLRGYGVFDFCRTHLKKPFLLDQYLKRFYHSALHLGLEVPYEMKRIKEVIYTLLDKNDIFEAGIRMVLTGGYTENGFTPGKPNFFILVEKINFPAKEYYVKGIKLYLYEHQRELSHIKSINYLSSIALRNKIDAAGAFDVLFHKGGNILEVSRSNFFIVKEGVLITPSDNILMGITRASVIDLALPHLRVEERDISMDELWQADEAFMTGTTKKVLPVVQTGDHMIGAGSPGPLTRKLMDWYTDFEEKQVDH